MTDDILVVDNVIKRFGGLTANANISFSMKKGEIIGLIGPNGAGKSTLFNCISCFYNADSGMVVFKGKDITRKDPESICAMGIGRTFQIVRIFKDMSVLENIMIGSFLRHRARKDAKASAEEVAGIFRFADKLSLTAASLTISEQKRLEVARVFATGPEVMLLDEMMAGLNVHEIKESVELVLKLRDMGISVILVEHVMEGIMPIANRVVVLDYGEKIAEGTPDEVTGDEKVIEAYFGEKYAKRRKHKAGL
ncbi:MAG TPA: ABC transporter ATP-binding protein [Syntrophales bacterium]|nr:ABC transporter ATP-binding protein [Syntrophales bacterium]